MSPLISALIVGIAMGALIQRVGASSPRMILASLRLENVAILKFMATTIAVGSVLVFVLGNWIPMHLDVKPLYVLGVGLGGLIFGVGFALGGYCPGTCVVGMGEGRRDALVAFLGGITGALVFTLAYAALAPVLVAPMNYGKLTLASVFGISPIVVSIALAALLLTGVTVITTARKPISDGRA
jgi:uncharacterized membrane protein YedE/YeeE